MTGQRIAQIAPNCAELRRVCAAHAAELGDELLLVGHVLAALERPHEVERVVGKRHVERVRHLKLHLVAQPLRVGERAGARRLHRAQRDPDALRAVLARDVPRRAADPAADVEDARRRRAAVAADAGPLEHRVDHVDLRLHVVLARAARVVAVVHVLAPHLLPHARALVVKLGDALAELGRRAQLAGRHLLGDGGARRRRAGGQPEGEAEADDGECEHALAR